MSHRTRVDMHQYPIDLRQITARDTVGRSCSSNLNLTYRWSMFRVLRAQPAAKSSAPKTTYGIVASAIAIAIVLGSCTDGDPCATDSDCPRGICVVDVDRGDSYCSVECEGDDDCEDAFFCDTRITGAPSNEDVVSVCLQRVRNCDSKEVCNGLDDNCDGTVDNDCETITCISDSTCGGLWPCAPQRSDNTFICQMPSGEGGPGTACSSNLDCYNDLCELGFCSSICHEDSHCPENQRCAKPHGSDFSTLHGSCHLSCDANSTCPEGMACTVRADPYGCRWRPVCAPSVGSTSLAFRCDDHDDCISALCVAGECTRPCASGMDCTAFSSTMCNPVFYSPYPIRCVESSYTICQ